MKIIHCFYFETFNFVWLFKNVFYCVKLFEHTQNVEKMKAAFFNPEDFLFVHDLVVVFFPGAFVELFFGPKCRPSLSTFTIWRGLV